MLELTWQDVAAAVRPAVQYLGHQAEGRPLYLTGYSTGAAPAVNYVLSALDAKPQVWSRAKN